jgi:anti-anti-sigma factor
MEPAYEALALHVEHTADRHGPVVHVNGEVDLATAPQLRECLRDLEGDVIVDLIDVSFLDSSGIGVLIAQRKRLAHGDGKLTLRNPNDIVARTLEAVGLCDWIEPLTAGPSPSAVSARL